MYSGHGRVCVCVSVCVPHPIPTLLHGPGCNLGNGRRCPLVLQCWAELQSVHGFRCYDNIQVCKLIALCTANAYSAEREVSAIACTHSVTGLICAGCAVEFTQQIHDIVASRSVGSLF